MLRIRLTRKGAKKNPIYRVVVAERRDARDGSFVEIVGHYNPKSNPPAVEFNQERIQHWLAKGAQPSETVQSLLRRVKPPAATNA